MVGAGEMVGADDREGVPEGCGDNDGARVIGAADDGAYEDDGEADGACVSGHSIVGNRASKDSSTTALSGP